MNVKLGVLRTDYEKNKKSMIQTFILYHIKIQAVSELKWQASYYRNSTACKHLQYQTTVPISHLHR